MHASRLLQQRRTRRRVRPHDDRGIENADLLRRKETLCNELARLDGVLERLQRRRSLSAPGPDISTDDLLEIFHEERARLFSQLRELDASLPADTNEGRDLLRDVQVTEFRRRALASTEPLDFS